MQQNPAPKVLNVQNAGELAGILDERITEELLRDPESPSLLEARGLLRECGEILGENYSAIAWLSLIIWGISPRFLDQLPIDGYANTLSNLRILSLIDPIPLWEEILRATPEGMAVGAELADHYERLATSLRKNPEDESAMHRAKLLSRRFEAESYVCGLISRLITINRRSLKMVVGRMTARDYILSSDKEGV